MSGAVFSVGVATATLLSLLFLTAAAHPILEHNFETLALPETEHPLSNFAAHRLRFAADTGISVNVSIDVLERNGQEATITWEGDSDPNFGDWLAVYVPADVKNLSTVAPVQYLDLDDVNSHRKTGSGAVRVKLLNHRQSMRVFMLKRAPHSPLVVGYSEPISVKNPNEPLRLHLAVTGKDGEMVVQWITAETSNPKVKWGRSPVKYDSEADAESTTYKGEEMCGEPAVSVGYIDPGQLHTAVMTGLKAGETYYYVVGDEDFGFSEEQTFKAPPLAGSGAEVKIVSVADMGQGMEGAWDVHRDASDAVQVADAIQQEEDLDLLMQIGDISYAMGHVADWDRFFDQWGPVTPKVPYMVSPGNHERDWPNSGDRYSSNHNSGGECGVAYERRFKMPVTGEDKPWYSFDFGPIHFLIFSAEHEFYPCSEQYSFIEKDLASVNRTVTPWVIFGGHRPMYLSAPKDSWGGYYFVSEELKAYLEDLLLKYEVDMTWAGHYHSYQRSCPVRKQRCVGMDDNGVALGPVHLVFGNAGADLYSSHVWRKYTDVIVTEHGYLRTTANASVLRCEAVRPDGSIIDSITLKKEPASKPQRKYWHVAQ